MTNDEDKRKALIDSDILHTHEVVPGLTINWDATEALVNDGIYLSLNTPINAT